MTSHRVAPGGYVLARRAIRQLKRALDPFIELARLAGADNPDDPTPLWQPDPQTVPKGHRYTLPHKISNSEYRMLHVGHHHMGGHRGWQVGDPPIGWNYAAEQVTPKPVGDVFIIPPTIDGMPEEIEYEERGYSNTPWTPRSVRELAKPYRTWITYRVIGPYPSAPIRSGTTVCVRDRSHHGSPVPCMAVGTIANVEIDADGCTHITIELNPKENK